MLFESITGTASPALAMSAASLLRDAVLEKIAAAAAASESVCEARCL